ncbi:MAG: M48 family metallopeptidase [Clostridia bacterium]|nr:M48 family metallopeptidase [Clostridia bacterium]
MPASSTQIRTLILPHSGCSLSFELERKSVKNLNLRIRRDGTIHLSIPRRTTIAAAEAFLRDREGWILQALARIEKRAEAHPLDSAVGDSLPYMGGKLDILWLKDTPARVEADLENHRLTVTLPEPGDPVLRSSAVETFEKAETQKLVTALVNRYYPIFADRGIPYPAHIRIKSIRSRFGSCAPATGSLNFAARLCEYPLPFIEYVVVHELCHFLQANHSASFWREVERVLPDFRERERLGKQ